MAECVILVLVIFFAVKILLSNVVILAAFLIFLFAYVGEQYRRKYPDYISRKIKQRRCNKYRIANPSSENKRVIVKHLTIQLNSNDSCYSRQTPLNLLHKQ